VPIPDGPSTLINDRKPFDFESFVESRGREPDGVGVVLDEVIYQQRDDRP